MTVYFNIVLAEVIDVAQLTVAAQVLARGNERVASLILLFLFVLLIAYRDDLRIDVQRADAVICFFSLFCTFVFGFLLVFLYLSIQPLLIFLQLRTDFRLSSQTSGLRSLFRHSVPARIWGSGLPLRLKALLIHQRCRVINSEILVNINGCFQVLGNPSSQFEQNRKGS